MKSFFVILTLLSTLFSTKIFATPLISGVSKNEINVDTEFTGDEILLFGVKSYSGDVLVAVRGPRKNFIVSKKEKLLGVWYNGQRINFEDAASFYSLYSTFRDGKMAENDLREYELGKNNIKFQITNKISPQKNNEFRQELVDLLEEKNLYDNGTKKIEFLNENLFKILISFPKNLILGTYIIEVYLINKGSVLSFQSIPVYVNQVGMSAEVSNFAQNQSVLYGLIAVFVAITIGFLINYLFVKFIKK